MPENSETGHAKNVANFNQLIFFIVGYGIIYNPSRPSISLTALELLATKSESGISNLNLVFSACSSVVTAREEAFEPMSKLSTRVLNALKATDTTAQTDNAAKTIVRKIQGQRASAKIHVPETSLIPATPLSTDKKEIKQISTSQMSFDSRLNNFDKLIRLVDQTPQYIPNETELKVVTLKAYYDDLKIKNEAAITATVIVSNARIARNEVLYTPITGTIDIASDVKVYIKSLFGAVSPQYKQISGLEFINIPK